jgi:ABC-type protease/lipase transport system fused ATPase/permease subunit
MTRPLLARSFLSSIARLLLRGDAAIFGRFAASIVMIATRLAVHGAQAFFLQLFALVSPLFFQVVIDKVLVHRSMSTLDVRVIGLVWSYEAIFEMEQPVTAIADYVEVLLIMGCDTELGEESQAAIYRVARDIKHQIEAVAKSSDKLFGMLAF